MFNKLWFRISQHRIATQRLGVFVLAAIISVLVNIGLLHVVYNPGIIIAKIVSAANLILDLIPGRDIFKVAKSPLLVTIFSMVFWMFVTRRHAWPRFKSFCADAWYWLTDVVISPTTTSALGVFVTLVLLYRQMKIGERPLAVVTIIVLMQWSCFYLVRSIKRYTIPAIKNRLRRIDLVLNAVDELRRGKNVERNKKILHAKQVEKQGEKSIWSKQSRPV